MIRLYTDGGVIGKNPSLDGGTWAYRILKDGDVYLEQSGILTPKDICYPVVTNNLTELASMLFGFSNIRNDWVVTVYTDSQITLGRVSLGWRWRNVPKWMKECYEMERERLLHFNEFKFVLVKAHPTKQMLNAGMYNGLPVSQHNVWCDRACVKQAIRFRELYT
jgi:ribonuclease HI